MATTPNRGYQLPAPGSKLKDDVLRLIAALGAIDTDVANLLLALADKSNVGHGHAMAEITGLVAALGNKLDVGYHDALANLTDVDVAGVANGMALLRQASKWIPVALQINNIAGLETALNGKATPADITAAINALVAAAPGTLDTLNELATALGNDPDFATTITNALAGKLAKDGSNVGDSAAQASFRASVGAASAVTALRDDVDQSAQSKASGLKVNILKNTLQAWQHIGESSGGNVAWLDVVSSDIALCYALRVTAHATPSAAANLDFRLSFDDGATWEAGASEYVNNKTAWANGSQSSGQAVTSSINALSLETANPATVTHCVLELFQSVVAVPAASNKKPHFISRSSHIGSGSGSNISTIVQGSLNNRQTPITGIRMGMIGATTYGRILVEGLRR